jgi:hypothetical protein
MIKFDLSIIALAWKTAATMTNLTLPGFFCEGHLNPQKNSQNQISYDDENPTIYQYLIMSKNPFIFTHI